ncbi:hypothetical protein SDC9_166925 [bioreactor metagenome]|uniref:Uncharacterized protein n=1 Tax=bioreactor metagenome TaxID=1076179 RepID=A0A645G5Y4_9ZZZZ
MDDCFRKIQKKYLAIPAIAGVVMLLTLFIVWHFLPEGFRQVHKEGAAVACFLGGAAIAILPLALWTRSRCRVLLLYAGFVIVFTDTIFILLLDPANSSHVQIAFGAVGVFWMILHLTWFLMIWEDHCDEKYCLFSFLLILDLLLALFAVWLNRFGHAFNPDFGFEPGAALVVFSAIFLGPLLLGSGISWALCRLCRGRRSGDDMVCPRE